MAGKGCLPGTNNGGGAKPGSLKRKTKERMEKQEAAASAGITPLEFMLQEMRSPPPKQLKDEPADAYDRRVLSHKAMQLDAAKAAAPYCHSRLQAIEVKTPEPIKIENHDPVDIAKRVAFILASALQGATS
jgi:hypothetical protein